MECRSESWDKSQNTAGVDRDKGIRRISEQNVMYLMRDMKSNWKSLEKYISDKTKSSRSLCTTDSEDKYVKRFKYVKMFLLYKSSLVAQ